MLQTIEAQNEVMINHGTLFNDRFILTVSLYLPLYTQPLFACYQPLTAEDVHRTAQRAKRSFISSQDVI